MSISIKVEYAVPEITEGLQSYDLRVEVTQASGMSGKVFVWQHPVTSATDQQANTLGGIFISVADPVDLEQYPEDEPDLENNIPYYRTDSVTLRFRSMEELQEVRTLIDEDLRGLVETLKLADELVTVEEKTYG